MDCRSKFFCLHILPALCLATHMNASTPGFHPWKSKQGSPGDNGYSNSSVFPRMWILFCVSSAFKVLYSDSWVNPSSVAQALRD